MSPIPVVRQKYTGRVIPLSPSRVWVGDLLHFARRVPGVPVVRRMCLRDVVRRRARLAERPSWVAIFTKAFAIAARSVPEFRRSLTGPFRPRLYEDDHSVASLAVEREYLGEPAVFFARIVRPDVRPLSELDAAIRHLRTADVAAVPDFRRLIRTTRLWTPVRRTLWWYGLYADPKRRAKRFGTFGVSSYSALGAESHHPLSPLSTVLNYGVFDAGGEVDVRLVYDHRVMDGATVARGLAEMDRVLTTELADELAEMDRVLTTELADELAEMGRALATDLAGERAEMPPPLRRLTAA